MLISAIRLDGKRAVQLLGKMSGEEGFEEERGNRGNIMLEYIILLFTYRFLLATRILPTKAAADINACETPDSIS